CASYYSNFYFDYW
nr:immunoglobulin heavy chain junction region [Mus musculus]MBK4183790.1 immunoglobulin heavy chain junction region [Mus musculus]MBK4183791.1 immunoglobulin heavy chain junction region [Mus musculus]